MTNELRDVIQAREQIGHVIDEKVGEREQIRGRKESKKKRDPQDEQRELELDREIDKLASQEAQLTKRIGGLKDRDEQLHAKAAELRKEAKAAQPDFGGHPSNVDADVKALIVIVQHKLDLPVTSTTDGTHAPSSYHYRGMAVDFGGPPGGAAEIALQRWAVDNADLFLECFGPQNDLCVKNGVRITLGEGTELENLHDNHVHLAPYPGAFT